MRNKAIIALGWGCLITAFGWAQNPPDFPQPKFYECLLIDTGIIVVDGLLDEEIWKSARWTDQFIDIEGEQMPLPYHSTEVKMLWDSENLYVFAALIESDLVATLKNHDDIIYRDNDFEIFVDLDGDTHNYCEIEVNLYNTVLDLFMAKPYRDAGPLVIDWQCRNLQTAVHYTGTLNDPSDDDWGWQVEMAIPWTSLGLHYKPNLPGKGDIIHVNFSRVQWDYEVVDGEYVKKTDEDGKRLPEHNWVWSPQGKINMHMPEMWGHVLLSDGASTVPETLPGEREKWILRLMYYAQREVKTELGRYARTIEELGHGLWSESDAPIISMMVGEGSCEISAHTEKVIYLIDETGHTWTKDIAWKKENSSN